MANHQTPLLARLTDWVLAHLIVVVTLAAAIAYSVLRTSYTTFYARFDVEPEEVGLGQTEILVQTGFAVLAAVVIIFLPLVLLYLVYRRFVTWQRHVPPGASFWTRALAFISGPYVMLVIPIVLLIGWTLFYDLPLRAERLADQVERGETVHSGTSFSLRYPFRVRAVPVVLRAVDGEPLPRELRSTSLRYLGRGGGTLILYDWKTRRVLRVPTDAFLVRTSRG